MDSGLRESASLLAWIVCCSDPFWVIFTVRHPTRQDAVAVTVESHRAPPQEIVFKSNTIRYDGALEAMERKVQKLFKNSLHLLYLFFLSILLFQIPTLHPAPTEGISLAVRTEGILQSLPIGTGVVAPPVVVGQTPLPAASTFSFTASLRPSTIHRFVVTRTLGEHREVGGPRETKTIPLDLGDVAIHAVGTLPVARRVVRAPRWRLVRHGACQRQHRVEVVRRCGQDGDVHRAEEHDQKKRSAEHFYLNAEGKGERGSGDVMKLVVKLTTLDFFATINR